VLARKSSSVDLALAQIAATRRDRRLHARPSGAELRDLRLFRSLSHLLAAVLLAFTRAWGTRVRRRR